MASTNWSLGRTAPKSVNQAKFRFSTMSASAMIPSTVETIVRSVTPGLDIESRTATAVLNLDARAAALQPGQVVRVRILTQAGPAPGSAITVPEEAVQSYEGRDVVFVRTDAGFVARPVTVVARAGGNAEIRAGLAPGEQVAGRNAFLVKAELGKSEASHED